jgi:CheY-like chemotaxis protein
LSAWFSRRVAEGGGVMSDGLPVIIVDDDSAICELIAELIGRFYSWGHVYAFTDPDEAVVFCRGQQAGVALFVLDVHLGEKDCFDFLDAIQDKFPMAYQDCVIITGFADDTLVDMCVAADITYLIEKPIKSYALQFAVRAIISKYIKFAKKLLQDPLLAEQVAGM